MRGKCAGAQKIDSLTFMLSTAHSLSPTAIFFCIKASLPNCMSLTYTSQSGLRINVMPMFEGSSNFSAAAGRGGILSRVHSIFLERAWKRMTLQGANEAEEEKTCKRAREKKAEGQRKRIGRRKRAGKKQGERKREMWKTRERGREEEEGGRGRGREGEGGKREERGRKEGGKRGQAEEFATHSTKRADEPCSLTKLR